MAEDLNPSYITMDLEMPNMKGSEAAKIILERNKDINIILITSIVNQKEIINTFKFGVKKFLQKTINIDKFKLAIEEVRNK